MWSSGWLLGAAGGRRDPPPPTTEQVPGCKSEAAMSPLLPVLLSGVLKGVGRWPPWGRRCSASELQQGLIPPLHAQLHLLLGEAVERGRGCRLRGRADSFVRSGTWDPESPSQRSRTLDLRPGPGPALGEGEPSTVGEGEPEFGKRPPWATAQVPWFWMPTFET